jgi:hypothetical protein
MVSRRAFVSWMSSVGAALGVGARARLAEATPPAAAAPMQGPTLDAVIVTRLGEVVLPAELGDAGIARVSRAFTQWIAAYRQGAELVHPYGSTDLRTTGPSPAARWRGQLQALERDARAKHRRGFIALNRDQRRALVTAAIEGERTNRMPDPIEAGHVAIALVAWYFSTPDAVDLCYRARIGRNACRPLVNAPREPLPLARTSGSA